MEGSRSRERERVKVCEAAEILSRALRGACSFSYGPRDDYPCYCRSL